MSISLISTVIILLLSANFISGPELKNDTEVLGVTAVPVDWQYPGSTSTQLDPGMVFITTDDPAPVTDWYQNYIEKSGYSVKNFIRTNSNGNIKNVLSASGEEDVTIEITKASNSKDTLIRVSL